MYRALADTVMVLHAAVVVFVVGGLVVIVAGNLRRWRWVNRLWFRVLHAAAIGVVVLQAWVGRHCGLTDLESWLRVRAGQAGYDAGFVQYWVERFLYYEAPMWVFALAYTLFGLLVALTWWYFPPARRSS
jgi:hypothetical protein